MTICGRTEQKLVDATARIAAGGRRWRHAPATSWPTSPSRSRWPRRWRRRHEATGRIDGLFACAGGSLHLGSVLTADVAAVRATIDLNLMGSVICVKQVGDGHAGPGRHRAPSS